MSRNRKMDFAAGIQDGIPICLGYIAVSFTFGIMAKNAGLSTWEAVLISLTNLTSAGQFAGLSLITASASYFEMAFTQLIINLRYSLMSCALSQKIDNHYPFFHRFLIAYGVTDEVFGSKSFFQCRASVRKTVFNDQILRFFCIYKWSKGNAFK